MKNLNQQKASQQENENGGESIRLDTACLNFSKTATESGTVKVEDENSKLAKLEMSGVPDSKVFEDVNLSYEQNTEL